MAQSTQGLASLWDTLRRHQLQQLAPDLLACGVRCLDDVVRRSHELIACGFPPWQVELLASGANAEPSPAAVSLRRDLPRPAQVGKASLALALQAASVNNRKRSLEQLEGSFLAPSTQPAVDSRVRTYQEICKAWGVDAFPITHESLKCLAASLKQGQYRSAALYFQAVFGHQQRVLVAPVDEFLRQCSKQFVRAITRGMGPAQLKDSFDIADLAMIPIEETTTPFRLSSPGHGRDLCLVSARFMVRELELAAARAPHLYTTGSTVNLLIPMRKTDQTGSLTLRSLRCACRIKVHALCPFHAAVRHLARVRAHEKFNVQALFPLVPDESGNTVSKSLMVEFMVRVIRATGTAAERPAADGTLIPRFGGHVLRVSGAQFLARHQVPLSTIQLLGRWTSSAVEKYVQSAPLVGLPNVAPAALHGVGPCQYSRDLATPSAEPPNSAVEVLPPAPPSEQAVDGNSIPVAVAEVQTGLADVQAQLAALKGAVVPPDTVFVHRKRSFIVHEGGTDEKAHCPAEWRTKCGWTYGITNFYRLSSLTGNYRRCRKCFRDLAEKEGDESPSDEASATDSADSDSSSSI